MRMLRSCYYEYKYYEMLGQIEKYTGSLLGTQNQSHYKSVQTQNLSEDKNQDHTDE